MNPLFGLVLLAAVILTTIRIKQGGQAARFLVVLFWIVFGFFTLIRPGHTPRGLPPTSWFFADLSMLPAILLTAATLAKLPKKWLLPAYGCVATAALYASFKILVLHLGMPAAEVRFAPEQLWPADGRMVEVHAEFKFCAVCDSRPETHLLSIDMVDLTNGKSRSVLDSVDTQQEAERGGDDCTLLLRAEPRPGLWRYHIVYRVTDASGHVGVVGGEVRVLQEPQATPRDPFWVN